MVRQAVELRHLVAVAEREDLERKSAYVRERLQEEEHFTLLEVARGELMSGRGPNDWLSDADFRAHVKAHEAELFHPEDVAFALYHAASAQQAEAIAEKLRAGGALEEVAPASLGLLARVSQGNYLAPAELPDAALRRALWATPPGGAAGPVEVDGQLYFARVQGRRPGAARSFESIHAALFGPLAARHYQTELQLRMAALAERYPARLIEEAWGRLAAGSEVGDDEVVARLGDREITAGRVRRRARSDRFRSADTGHKADLRPVLDAILEANRLLAYARERKLDRRWAAVEEIAASRVEVLSNAAIEHLRHQVKVPPEQVEQSARQVRARWGELPPQVRLEALVLRSRPDADRALRRLHDGATFESLKFLSTVRTPSTELGWFWPWELEEALALDATTVPVGEIFGPHPTPFGVVVARCLERKEARPPGDEEIRAAVLERLTRAAQDAALHRHRAEAWARAKVEVDEEALKKMWRLASHYGAAAQVISWSGRKSEYSPRELAAPEVPPAPGGPDRHDHAHGGPDDHAHDGPDDHAHDGAHGHDRAPGAR